MARHIFFSFHYKDVVDFRANVVRQSWVTKGNNNDVFYDKSLWESTKTNGTKAIKNLIDSGLYRTSVTSVLIGSETHERRWVKYEIVKSFADGNGLFGVYINRIRGKDGRIHARGLNPFDRLALEISSDGGTIYFYELINGKWQLFTDLSSISNKKSNTLYFDDGGFWRESSYGKSFLFSDFFKAYCWDFDNGYKNITDWVEDAAEQAGR